MATFLYKTLIQIRNPSTIPPLSKLQCRQLLRFSHSAAASDPQSFTISYLTSSCSLSPEAASSASKLVTFDSAQKPDSVIAFLKNRGFSNSQISFIIKKFPRLLLSDSHKTLLPKLEFLYDRGASSSEATTIVSRAPKILKRSVSEHLIPTFEFLKSFLQSDERTLASIKRYPSLLSDVDHGRLIGSVETMLDAGVPKANVRFFLLYQPRMFAMGLDRFREILEDVRKMGFDPSKSGFSQAVHALRAMSKSTWAKKINVYKRWGLCDEEILAAFRSQPWCMVLSEEKIMLGMDFFVNKLGWKSVAVVKNPVLLSFSLKNRLIPRGSVLLFLFRKGLIKNKFMSGRPFVCTETEFLQKFVHPHLEEVPQLLKLYSVNEDGGINQL